MTKIVAVTTGSPGINLPRYQRYVAAHRTVKVRDSASVQMLSLTIPETDFLSSGNVSVVLGTGLALFLGATLLPGRGCEIRNPDGLFTIQTPFQ